MNLSKKDYDKICKNLKKGSKHITLDEQLLKIENENIVLDLFNSKTNSINFKINSCTDYLWEQDKSQEERNEESIIILIPSINIRNKSFCNFLRALNSSNLFFKYYSLINHSFCASNCCLSASGTIKKDSSGMFYPFKVSKIDIWAFIVTFRMYYLNTKLSNYLFWDNIPNTRLNDILSILHLISNRNDLIVSNLYCVFFKSNLFYNIARNMSYRGSLGLLCSTIRDSNLSYYFNKLLLKSRTRIEFNIIVSEIIEFYNLLRIDNNKLIEQKREGIINKLKKYEK